MARFLLRFPPDSDQVVNIRAFMASHDPWVQLCTLSFDGGMYNFEVVTLEGQYRPQNEEFYLLIMDAQVDPPLPVHQDPPYPQWTQRPILGFDPGRRETLTGHTTPEIRQQIISEYIRNADSRRELAVAMVNPLRARRDYQSVARRTFLVEQLPEGASPFYEGADRVVESRPLTPLPTWVVPGTWVENTDTGFIGHVVATIPELSNFTLEHWQTKQTLHTHFGQDNSWHEISEPHEGLPWYERLDDL